MFIEISDIKKSYGAGESRVEVLKGIASAWKRESSACCWDRPEAENPRC